MRPIIRQTFSTIGPIRFLSVLYVKTVNANYAFTETKTGSPTVYFFIIQPNPRAVLVYELLENLYRETISKHNLMLQSAESTRAQVATGC